MEQETNEIENYDNFKILNHFLQEELLDFFELETFTENNELFSEIPFPLPLMWDLKRVGAIEVVTRTEDDKEIYKVLDKETFIMFYTKYLLDGDGILTMRKLSNIFNLPNWDDKLGVYSELTSYPETCVLETRHVYKIKDADNALQRVYWYFTKTHPDKYKIEK